MAGGNENKNMNVRYKHFRGVLKSWESLFEEGSKFATSVGKDRLISISHSSDHSEGIVTVWYWEQESDPENS
jgi:hypothetical protein